MRKTSGNKTIRQKIKAAKLMNGKRATKDRLKNYGITINNTCIMRERKTEEANKYILCYGTNPQMVMKRREAKGKIIALIDEHKNTVELKQVATLLYGTNDKGRALNLKNEKTIPAKWRQSWNKKEEDRTQYIEAVEGRAAEVAIKLGNIAPQNEERREMWRCEECIEEKGPARCSFAIYQIRNKTGSDAQ